MVSFSKYEEVFLFFLNLTEVQGIALANDGGFYWGNEKWSND